MYVMSVTGILNISEYFHSLFKKVVCFGMRVGGNPPPPNYFPRCLICFAEEIYILKYSFF